VKCKEVLIFFNHKLATNEINCTRMLMMIGLQEDP